jgi:hypothetical protein
MESLKQLVSEYQDINFKVQNLNRGGCGIFAEHLYITLKKMGYKPRIVCLTRDKEQLKEFVQLNTTDCSDFYNLSIGHVVIMINGKLIDSRGIHNTVDECWSSRFLNQKYYKLTIRFDLLRTWNNDRYFWNNSFDRKNIKTIEKRLKNCYEKINKNLVESI